MSDPIYITSLHLKDIFGFTELKLAPKMVNIISGKNGVGKSTLLEAIKLVFAGGFKADWVRQGCDEGTVEGELSSGYKFTVRLALPTEKRRKATRTVTVTAATGEEVEGGHQTFLDSLTQGLAYDPIKFITCGEKERAEYIQKFLPVEMTVQEFHDAVDMDWWGEHWAKDKQPFDIIKSARDAAYDRRTKVNKEHRDLQGATQKLRDGIPTLAEDGRDWEGEERAAAAKQEALLLEAQAAKQDIEAESKAARDQATITRLTRTREILAEYNAKLAELNAWKAAQDADADLAKSKLLEAVSQAESECLREHHDKYGPAIYDASHAHAVARNALMAYREATGARKQLEVWDGDIRHLAGEANRLTNCIDRLDALKKKLLDSSPIPGVTVENGKVLVDGRDFDLATNTARKIEVSVSIATQIAGACPLMIIDDLHGSALDAPTFESLKEAMREAGFQLFAGRVSEGALRIETEGALA